jgi:MerR family mercuric resistance operon transcriptional regulator
MKRMTIGVLAEASSTGVTTIRYYERVGLLPSPQRSAGGHRNYTEGHLRLLLFIRRARELQFNIQQIRALLVLAEPAQTSCHDVHQLAAVHLKALRHKITELTRLERLLATAVDRCSGKPVPPCPVLELLQSSGA